MRKPPATTALDLNLAPMVDVMMCLLIFFMMATRMVQQETSRIDLPLARTAADIGSQPRESRFVVNIRPDEKDPARAVYLIREEAMSIEDVLARLEIERIANRELTCVIRADRSITYRFVEAVLAGCAQLQVQTVWFSATTEAQEGD